MSHEKRDPGWLDYIGDDILPSYIGIVINDYKDPYERTSIMESRSFFCFVAQFMIPFFERFVFWTPSTCKRTENRPCFCGMSCYSGNNHFRCKRVGIIQLKQPLNKSGCLVYQAQVEHLCLQSELLTYGFWNKLSSLTLFSATSNTTFSWLWMGLVLMALFRLATGVIISHLPSRIDLTETEVKRLLF